MPRPPILHASMMHFLLLLLSTLAASLAWSQEQKKDTPDGDYSAELPRLAPTEPAEAIGKFTLAPGFRIELVACEPEVVDPVAMAFDEAGRIYVVEMRDYSEQDQERLGRIRLLEDRDADGRYETASLFAEGLSWPTAILCYDGGVFVGAAPDLLYLKDENGDGRIERDSAAEHRVIYTGFGRSNVQGLMNSFQWGPDNRVYVALSSSGAKLRTPSRPDLPETDFRGRDLVFDPKTLQCESIAGGAQHGMTFTKWGERLVCSNSDHLQWIAYDDAHAAKNPFLPAPPARVSIAADGPQAEVYRTSPVEPWRIVRTRLRTTGVVPGIVEGGGRASGYFTSATGVTAVTGTAFPPVPGDPNAEWVIVGDVGSNLVHRKKLFLKDGMLRGERVDEKSELLTSSDNWFRPVQFANGPDGALYILDMYREVIEHPASLPPAIKKHLDLTSGRDRGRIWRLVKEDFKREPPRDLGKLSTEELIACLGDDNGWTRTTASRLLYERTSPESTAALQRSALRDDLSPIALYHHLHLLASQPEASEALISQCLAHSDAQVRLAALRICEKVPQAKLTSAIAQRLADPHPLVRRSAAFALASLKAPEALPSLVAFVREASADAFTRYAVLTGFREDAGKFLRALAEDEGVRQRDASRIWFADLAAIIRNQDAPSDVNEAGQAVQTALAVDKRFGVELFMMLKAKAGPRLAGALELATGGKSAELRAEYFAASRAVAVDAAEPLPQRQRALARLVDSRFGDERATLDQLLSPEQPSELQLGSIELTARFTDADVAPWLLEKWPSLTPATRERALGVLTSRAPWLEALLKALEERTIAPLDIPPSTRSLLSQHPSEAIRKRAAALLGQSTKKERETILTAYRSSLSAAGDAAKGKANFKQHCSACHKLEGVGNETGPNLAAMKARGAEAILTNVLDPNREVLPQFQSYVAELEDGRVISGMIESESPTTILLRKADGQREELLRGDIESLRSTGQSLMPEGLEKQLDPAAMADLLAYLLKAE